MRAERTFTISASRLAGVIVLVADGVLDSTTYTWMRNEILEAALDEPDAVIVDVSRLDVPAPSALAVFTSARWHIGQWPDIPMALVCEHQAGRKVIERNGITRYVPVYPTTAAAMSEILRQDSAGMRRRARAELPAAQSSTADSRRLVAEWLTAWGQPEFIASAKLIMSVFVENVLAHTDSAPDVRLESNAKTVTIAVADGSAAPAALREVCPLGEMQVSGLAIVAALSLRWGNAPTPSGKTVWALIGPENLL
jgi:STAS domain-containing protein